MRKRLFVAGTIVAACGTLAMSGVLGASAATTPAAGVSAPPVSPPPTRLAAPQQEVLGDVIGTGFRDSSGELVFYGVELREPRLPLTTFGVMAGVRDAAGGLTDLITTNETTGDDRAPGFHGVTGGARVDGHDVPVFGYYAGPAAKITATIQGTTAVAHQARWSADPNVVVFWLDRGTADPQALAAYDAAGGELPAGDTGIGHG